MQPTNDDWSDADFESQKRVWSSVEQLHASILARLQEGILDPHLNEDLRLFICVRLLEQRTESELVDDLIKWGLDSDFVITLVTSTRAAGQFGVVEISTSAQYEGALAVWASPTFEGKRQLNARAVRRWKQARELLNGMPEVESTPVDLGFTPDALTSGMSPAVRRALRRRAIISVAIAILLLGALFVVLRKLIG